MLYSLLQYLIESTLYLISVLIIYRVFLWKLTHFKWMRVYLLGGLALGLVLPLITLPIHWLSILPGANSIERPLGFTFLNSGRGSVQESPGSIAPVGNSPLSFRVFLGYGIGMAYLSVVIYRLIQLAIKLLRIRSSIRSNPKERKDGYWFIQSEISSPAFSFFNYIFIHKNLGRLDKEERERIASHEIIHARQYHTLDILFMELVSALFWFNPLLKSFKNYLQEVHEYLADDFILKNKAMKQSYSNLLLKLTSEENPPLLSSAFSARQIGRRISMIGRSRSLPRYRILFFFLLPVAAFLLMSFSYLEVRASPNLLAQETQSAIATSSQPLKVGTIAWTGNTIFTDAQLNKRLGIESGDDYSGDFLNQRLWLDEVAVNNLYLDDGYIFYHSEVEEVEKEKGTVDLNITIYEGEQVRIGHILIEGNGSIPKRDILKVILIKPGELFSKTKLIESVRAIAKMGLFDPENIVPNPTPIKDPISGEFTTVDIEFKMVEK